MPWFNYHDKTFHVKRHSIDDSLRPLLTEDLKAQFEAELWEEESTTKQEIFFEPGGYGMYYTNQPRVVFTVGGKNLRIDVIKTEELLLDLQNAKKETFTDGTEYYKFFSRFHCLVLTVPEREELLFQLRGQLPALAAQGNAWLEEKDKEWEQMKTEFKEENGTDFPLIRAKDLRQNKSN